MPTDIAGAFNLSIPQFMRSDNGSEFIAGIIKEFLAENNIKAAYIEPGSRVAEWQRRRVSTVNSETNVCGWKSSAIGARLLSSPNNGASFITANDRTAV